jgi:hypothetical protein
MEVGNQGANVASRVLLWVLPFALSDGVDVVAQTLWPIKVSGVVQGVDLPCIRRHALGRM